MVSPKALESRCDVLAYALLPRSPSLFLPPSAWSDPVRGKAKDDAWDLGLAAGYLRGGKEEAIKRYCDAVADSAPSWEAWLGGWRT